MAAAHRRFFRYLSAHRADQPSCRRLSVVRSRSQLAPGIALLAPGLLPGGVLFERSKQSDRQTQIGYWRLGGWALSVLASVLRFHSPITYPLTLNCFAFYVYFWLRKEVEHADGSRPGWAERAGAFSYSIYLIHPAAHELWRRWSLVPSLGTGADWIVSTVFILAAALVFYLFVERPSHGFSRQIYFWLRQRSTVALAEGVEIPPGTGAGVLDRSP